MLNALFVLLIGYGGPVKLQVYPSLQACHIAAAHYAHTARHPWTMCLSKIGD